MNEIFWLLPHRPGNGDDFRGKFSSGCWTGSLDSPALWFEMSCHCVTMWNDHYDLYECSWMCWAGISRSVLHHCAVCSARAPAFVARRLNRFEAVLAGPASHFDAPLTSFLMTKNTACLQCQPNIDHFPSTLKRLLVTVENWNAINLYLKVTLASSLCSGWVVFMLGTFLWHGQNCVYGICLIWLLFFN